VSIQVRPPDLHLPHVGLPRVNRRDVGHAADVARTFLPPPERIVYYGGLGALAAVGLIEWPVAAAIGAGTMIVQRSRARQDRWSPLRGPQPERGAPAEEGKAPERTPRGTAQRGETKGEAKTPARGAAARARAGAR
jgi:hypothetical protein